MSDATFSYEQDFFADFPTLKELFIKEGRKYTLRRGSPVFYEGSPSDVCYYIASGEVYTFYLGENGKEAPLSIYYKGALFGVSDIFAGHRRRYRAVTMKPTILYAVKRERLLDLVSCNYDFTLKLLSLISKYKIYEELRLASMILYKAPKRCICFLVFFHNFLAEMSTSSCEGPIPLCLSQNLLADMFGSTQGTVSRLLRELREEGMLDSSIKYITIPDAAALWGKIFQQSFRDA